MASSPRLGLSARTTIQADQYSQGALAGLELRSHRYIIVVTLKDCRREL
jgi:hypothetical protein